MIMRGKDKSKRIECDVRLERISLNRKNPRHDPCESEAQAIESLCKSDQILPLARDIVANGLNPIDRFGLMAIRGSKDSYTVIEGNRRVCALKLLTDPDLAPTVARRETYAKLAEDWTPVEVIPCVIFKDAEDLDLWLERRHKGQNGGIGQKAWGAVQQARHSGSRSPNTPALAILDYALSKGIITLDQSKNRITTIRRFLEKKSIRKILGLDVSDVDRITTSRTDEDFELLVRKFFNDLLAKDTKVDSRANKEIVDSYAQELDSVKGQSYKQSDPTPIFPSKSKPEKKPRKHPSREREHESLPLRSDIMEALEGLDSWKLKCLYQSILKLPLRQNYNIPLLALGIWSFFETLTALAGRDGAPNFQSFLSQQKLSNYGWSRDEVRALRLSIDHLANYGTVTKHHPQAAAFNSFQIHNDMVVLGDLILKLIEDVNSDS